MPAAITSQNARSLTAVLIGLLMGLAVLGLAACAPSADAPTDAPGVDIAADPVVPAPWDLASPESAVRSYLDWVSFSYRMANSEIPSATMTPEEGVRVDSYIQLNRMEDKGLEQALERFEVTSLSEEGSRTVLAASETWRYRYFSLSTLKYLTEPLSASYDTTYTLVTGDAGWLVDRVEATALGELQ